MKNSIKLMSFLILAGLALGSIFYIEENLAEDVYRDEVTTVITVNLTENHPPVAIIDEPDHAFVNRSVVLFGSKSYDPDGYIVNYTWDFGDGNKSFLPNPSHVYRKPGTYTVTLTVRDNIGLNDTAISFIIVVPPVPKHILPFTLDLLIKILPLIGVMVAFMIIFKNVKTETGGK